VEIFGPLPVLAAIRDNISGVDSSDASSAIYIYTKASAAYAVPELIEALQDDNAKVRESAVKALLKIGPAAVEATTPLIERLEDPDEWVKRYAATALGEVAAGQTQAIPPLIQALQSTDFYLRRAAAEALGEFGPLANEAVPDLLNLLKDENEKLRRAAAISLVKIGGDGIDQALSFLIDDIDNENQFARLDVYRALQILRDQAMPAVPALIEAISSEKENETELIRTLQVITGVKLNNQEEWQKWWESSR
jgi:HEAT repeat protein